MSDPLQTIAEHLQPTYDRNTDVRVRMAREADAAREFYFALPEVVATPGREQNGAIKTFFDNKKFPPVCRQRVYSYLFELPADGKKVLLSKDFAVKDVFPPDHFIMPWDLIKKVAPAMFTCRQMRDELMTHFWSTYQFHVTFSAFTLGPSFSGLSIKWLNLYGDRINHLTVEVDFTKLGFAAAKNAQLLDGATVKIQKAIQNLIDSILGRHGRNVMADLHLMVRRYEGMRPNTDTEDPPVPYCPELALEVFNPIGRLRSSIIEFRMSGFSQRYTNKLMRSVYGAFGVPPTILPITNPAWPAYTPAPPDVLYHSSFTSSQTNGPETPTTSGSITPTASFASSSRSNVNMLPTPGFMSSRATPQLTPYGSFASSSYGTTASEPSPGFSSSGTSSFNGNGGRPTGLGLGLGIDIGLPAPESFSDEVEMEIARRNAVIPSRGDSLPSAPKSPNTMNRMNEQDPAFKRAFDAMKINSEENAVIGGKNDADGSSDDKEGNGGSKGGKAKKKSKGKKKKGKKH